MDTDLAELNASLARLKAVVETELKGINARLGKMEATQTTLVKHMTVGRTTVRVLKWTGAAVLAIGSAVTAAIAALWERFG